MATEDAWYQELRERYRPEHVRLLLIGESAPTDHGGTKPRNFFYADHLGPDNLYRGVLGALYGQIGFNKRTPDKQAWLQRLQADGVFLIDLAPYPVNDIKPESARMAVLRDHAPACIEAVKRIGPEGIVLAGGVRVYDALAQGLRTSNLPLLHDQPISFPLGNTRQEFIARVRQAVALLGLVDLEAGTSGR